MSLTISYYGKIQLILNICVIYVKINLQRDEHVSRKYMIMLLVERSCLYSSHLCI